MSFTIEMISRSDFEALADVKDFETACCGNILCKPGKGDTRRN